jgi:hypothetical protein
MQWPSHPGRCIAGVAEMCSPALAIHRVERNQGRQGPTRPPGLRAAAAALRAVSPHAGGWLAAERMPDDEVNLRYSDPVTGSYDCADRIVLNAFFPLGHNPGRLRGWWRDAGLDKTHLMRMAGRFARRVKVWPRPTGCR